MQYISEPILIAIYGTTVAPPNQTIFRLRNVNLSSYHRPCMFMIILLRNKFRHNIIVIEFECLQSNWNKYYQICFIFFFLCNFNLRD